MGNLPNLRSNVILEHIYSLGIVSVSVPSKKTLHCANFYFSVRGVVQPCRATNSKVFQALIVLCDIYTILSLKCCKCARMRFHCANSPVVLHFCAVAHFRGNIV